MSCLDISLDRTIISDSKSKKVHKFVEENKVVFMRIFREPVAGVNRYIGKYKYPL